MHPKLVFVFGALALILTACGGNFQRSVQAISNTPVPLKKVLGAFYPIEGTQYQLASIAVEQGESGRGYDFSELFSYGRSDYGVYNYVFFDTQAETVRALLPGNTQLILSIQGYPPPKSSETDKTPTAWWRYTIIKADTNNDGQLSSLDRKTLAVSDVGGNGYAEMIADVDQVLGDVFKDGDTLLIIYRVGDKNFLAHIDLPARKVTRTTELPSFGEDVK